MARDIYVRAFDSELYDVIKNKCSSGGGTLATVLETAVRCWLRQEQKKSETKHILLIYENVKSLGRALRLIDRLIPKDWSKVLFLHDGHLGFEVLLEKGWKDATLRPYKRFLQAPKGYSLRAWQRIMRVACNKRVCVISDPPDLGKLSGERNLKRAILERSLEEELRYNSVQRIPGIMFCPYSVEDLLLRDGLEYFLRIADRHDEIFIISESGIHKLRVTRETPYKIISI